MRRRCLAFEHPPTGGADQTLSQVIVGCLRHGYNLYLLAAWLLRKDLMTAPLFLLILFGLTPFEFTSHLFTSPREIISFLPDGFLFLFDSKILARRFKQQEEAF